MRKTVGMVILSSAFVIIFIWISHYQSLTVAVGIFVTCGILLGFITLGVHAHLAAGKPEKKGDGQGS